MISLDTNYLIRGLIAQTPESDQLLDWIEKGEPITISSIAWYEYLSGAKTPEEEVVASSVITHGIKSFGEVEAEESRRIWKAAGQSRRLRIDAMIAATAIIHQSTLATQNKSDFEPFVCLGLRLLK